MFCMFVIICIEDSVFTHDLAMGHMGLRMKIFLRWVSIHMNICRYLYRQPIGQAWGYKMHLHCFTHSSHNSRGLRMDIFSQVRSLLMCVRGHWPKHLW